MTTFIRVAGAVSALVVVAAVGAVPAQADAMTAAQILSSFNLVTTGNVSTQSDIVGNAVVGGDLNGATFFGGGANVPASPDLYVFGKLNGSLNLNSGGSLYYAGGSSPKVNYNGGGKLHTTLPNPLGDYTDPLTDLSAQLADLTATAGTSFVNGKFNAGSNSGVVVFEISGSTLASDLVNHDISFAGTGVTSYIINVIGNFTQPNSTHFNVDQEDALFNFENATTVNLGQWGASILAPDAAVKITGGGNIEGSVFAKSFLGGGELHNNNLFNGVLPSAAVTATAPIPEPSTWAMLIAGFAGLAYLGWRKAREAAVVAA
ncbi:MAG TPA: collagen-binding domain-containing protein [Roseiarcus sp.]|jgi:choice-of-anchor A domain-containing protein